MTHILASLVQSCHPLVPPEEMNVIVKTIANNFVTDRNNAETIAVGINAIREIFHRIPLVLEEEGKLIRLHCPRTLNYHFFAALAGMDDLVHDLVQYSSYLERGVRYEKLFKHVH